MVSSDKLIRVIAERLRYHKAKNVVVDPVMVATSGSSLMKTDAVQTLIDELLPIAALITPNIPKAQILSELEIKTEEDMLAAAKRIGDDYGCAVLLKGGHSVNDANDLLYANGEYHWFEGKRIDNPNTGKWVAIAAAVIGTVGAIFLPLTDITDFLYFIGSVFAPMIAIQIADFFILKKDSGERKFNIQNLIIWIVGFIIYRLLMRVDIVVGNTLPDMVITIVLCVAVSKIGRCIKKS